MGDNIVNFYAGQPPLNRLSFQRADAGKVTQHLDAAWYILFKDAKPLVKPDAPGQLLLLPRQDVAHLIGDGFANPDGSRALETARLPHTLAPLVFLGIDDRASQDGTPAAIDPLHPQGTPYFAIDVGRGGAEFEARGEWGDARGSANAMDGWSAGVFAQARALVDWNARNRFCPACGSPTYSLWAGWKRSCLTAVEPSDNEPCFSLQGLHNFAYPRTDPVIIMGILDVTGDRMLLGRQSKWPRGMYSCLAGFVEPGESFEDAVRREVMEEAGVLVGPVRYSSSQPWPYPANLMVGCYGRAKDGQTIRLDLDNELEDAQWFSRAEIAALIATPSGTNYSNREVKQLETANALAPSERTEAEENKDRGAGLSRVPPDTAIAGMLIRQWAEGSLELVSRL